MKLYLPDKPNLQVLTLNPQSRYHLYWLDTRPGTAQSLTHRLQQHNITAVNLGHTLALFLQNPPIDKYIAYEVEEFVRRELESAAKPVNGSANTVVAVYNIGILFEPAFHLDPARLLKDIAKRIGIILVWEDEFEPPGRFFWDADPTSAVSLDLSDANIQQITL